MGCSPWDAKPWDLETYPCALELLSPPSSQFRVPQEPQQQFALPRSWKTMYKPEEGFPMTIAVAGLVNIVGDFLVLLVQTTSMNKI